MNDIIMFDRLKFILLLLYSTFLLVQKNLTVPIMKDDKIKICCMIIIILGK